MELTGKMIPLGLVQDKMLSIGRHFEEFCRLHELSYFVCGGTLLGAVRHGGFIPWDDDFDVAMPRADFERFLMLWSDDADIKVVSAGSPGYFKKGTPAKMFDANSRVSEINEEENGMPKFGVYGVFIDIFPLDQYPDNVIGRLLNKYLGRAVVASCLCGYHLRATPLLKRVVIKLFRLVPTHFLDSLVEMGIRYVSRSKCKQKRWGYGVETPFTNLWLEDDKLFPVRSNCLIDGVAFCGPNSPAHYLEQRFGDYMTLPPESERRRHIVDVQWEVEE